LFIFFQTCLSLTNQGEFLEADTLNQVWPKKKRFAPSWWWKEDARP
jgi:hypothetical protein